MHRSADRELARHSDIRMTMRYTHIGLEDQARAVAAIPGTRVPQLHQSDTESWQPLGSQTCAKACHLPSSAGIGLTMELATAQDKTPCGETGSIAVCPRVAIGGTPAVYRQGIENEKDATAHTPGGTCYRSLAFPNSAGFVTAGLGSHSRTGGLS